MRTQDREMDHERLVNGLDENDMKLGQLAWKLEPQPQERERLASLLSSEGHIARTIFKKYARRVESFDRGAKSLQKDINGFRPGSDGYSTRAIDRMLTDLALNKAPLIGWTIYRETIASFVENDRPIMHTMMRSVDVEVGEDCTNVELSHEFLKAVCEHSAEFEVYDSDIGLLYELWPVDRLEDYEALLKFCPKCDRLKVAETAVYGLRDEFSELKGKLSESIEKTVTRRISDVHFPESIKRAEKRIRKHTHEVVRSDFRKLSADLETVVAQFEGDTGSLAADHQGLRDSYEELKASVDQCRSEIERLARQVEGFEANRQLTPSEPGIVRDPQVAWPTNSQRQVVLREMSEDVFLAAFVDRCDALGLEQSTELLRAAHCILKSAAVVASTNSELIGAWIDTLGWNEYVLRFAASPAWSTPNEWIEGQLHLSGATTDPRIAFILDYDVGFVEAFLNPPLRLWTEYTFASSAPKLFLFQSVPGEEGKAGLRAPIVSLDALVEGMAKIKRCLLPKATEWEDQGVSRAGLESWIVSPSDLQSMLAERSHGDAFDEVVIGLKECRIAPSKALKLVLRQISAALESHGFDRSGVVAVCMNTLILPWVQGNYGSARSSELKVYFGA